MPYFNNLETFPSRIGVHHTTTIVTFGGKLQLLSFETVITKCEIRKSYFHSETVLFSQTFVLLMERDRSVIRLDKIE